MEPKTVILDEFFCFLEDCPSYFHVIQAMENRLKEAGFKKLSESDNLADLENGNYYIIRNDTGIAVFRYAKENPKGFRIIGTHTDSPSLRVKPNPDLNYKSYTSLGVEVYGGAILSSWFDRDLSIAGRVSYLDKKNGFSSALVDFKTPVALLPSLAIHLSKRDGDGKINRQKELPVLLLQRPDDDETTEFTDVLKKCLEKTQTDIDVEEILGHDLFLYDTQKPAVTGVDNKFVSAGKLDNLLSTFVGFKAVLEAQGTQNCMLIANCHEEVGSHTDTGAGGSFLEAVLERLSGNRENYFQTLACSFLISADNAHAAHPNYPERHDSNHLSELNKGPVIKLNANQRYITTGKSSSLFKMLCRKADIPCQEFVSRSDMPCGSTIGPFTATRLGIEALDIGAPTFAMHSIREVCGVDDVGYMCKVLKSFCDEKAFK